MTVEDVSVYAAAHAVRRLVERELADGSAADGAVAEAAQELTALVAQALDAGLEHEKLARYRQAWLVLELMRHGAYALLRSGALANGAFDAIVRAAAACRREVAGGLTRARQRAWARLHGIQGRGAS